LTVVDPSFQCQVLERGRGEHHAAAMGDLERWFLINQRVHGDDVVVLRSARSGRAHDRRIVVVGIMASDAAFSDENSVNVVANIGNLGSGGGRGRGHAVADAVVGVNVKRVRFSNGPIRIICGGKAGHGRGRPRRVNRLEEGGAVVNINPVAVDRGAPVARRRTPRNRYLRRATR